MYIAPPSRRIISFFLPICRDRSQSSSLCLGTRPSAENTSLCAAVDGAWGTMLSVGIDTRAGLRSDPSARRGKGCS